MYAILAPVPAILIEESLAIKPIAAFGSGWLSESTFIGSLEFFQKLTVEHQNEILRVLIYGSKTDLTEPHRLYRPSHITAIARYEGFNKARDDGKHVYPEQRAPSALKGDTPATVFWKVSGLSVLDKPYPLKNIKLPAIAPSMNMRPYRNDKVEGPLKVVEPEGIDWIE